jgi:hypothetical protein
LLLCAGLYDTIYNHFDQPDLLDDVTDHWSSGAHRAEKIRLLEGIVAAASQTGCRVTIVSGDVHLCAVGYMQSRGQAGDVQAVDPAFITQIVSSAVGNKPPANLVVSWLDHCTRQAHRLTKQFQEGMTHFFNPNETPAGSKFYNNRQNYCEIQVAQSVKNAQGCSRKPLSFSLVILGGDPVEGDTIGSVRTATIPPLLPANSE